MFLFTIFFLLSLQFDRRYDRFRRTGEFSSDFLRQRKFIDGFLLSSQRKPTHAGHSHAVILGLKEFKSLLRPLSTTTMQKNRQVKRLGKNQRSCSNIKMKQLIKDQNSKTETLISFIENRKLTTQSQNKININKHRYHPSLSFQFFHLPLRSMFDRNGLGISGNLLLTYHHLLCHINCHGNQVFLSTYRHLLRRNGNRICLHGNLPRVLPRLARPFFPITTRHGMKVHKIGTHLFPREQQSRTPVILLL